MNKRAPPPVSPTMKLGVTLLLLAIGCGGEPFSVGRDRPALELPDAASDAQLEAEGAPADPPESGGADVLTEGGGEADAAPEADALQVEADACGGQVALHSSCPVPGGEQPTLPALFVTAYPAQGTCAAVPTPPECACTASYTCACIAAHHAEVPCGVTACAEADLDAGVALTVQCL